MTPALKPRAVAVLVCLRGGPLSSRALRGRICDKSLNSTTDLLGDLCSLGLVDCERGEWSLADGGRAWLRESGVAS